MSVVRYKGRLMKEKVLKKRLKALAAMSEAKKKKKSCQEDNHLCVGRRIVEVSELAKNLTCCYCEKDLSLKNVVNERRLGLNSILKVRCRDCSTFTDVATGKIHTSKDNSKHSDVNTKIVLGAVHAGVGCSGINKILACMNIPSITPNLFKRYEREVGPAIEEAAKESCKQAAKEERRLIVENVEKLCQEL
ncbi:uncharacterized protein LOC112461272 [Temnothorax curvispinosus]|uniref:Uncharacterized protein LOC112461272 n=1 Tax=Temnothorax curvispinosus TaxID=300111 RepID=A0A6J1QIK3_9HYME|nr:uncharacterized protein LOC112461272 [Temnothorax curvispinosus]